ncbi:hypothetical protein GCM10023161_25260 [Mycobacterium paraffinicum]|uniref:Condensation domain-containing protein n=1 Tax=Mycobacterium paraffinicum TaxID=53378 RepID=A0ABP8RLT9_9MYCO|nr:hypothetical protein [Mycobacterium paraffinicum]
MRGGGGFASSDFELVRLSQQDIDELERQYRIADILPPTPLQQGLHFLTSTAHGRDDVYAVQLDITLSGALDQQRLCDAVRMVVIRRPNLAARFCEGVWRAGADTDSWLMGRKVHVPVSGVSSGGWGLLHG